MLSKVTKVKLGVFIAITVVALLVTALYYVRLPQQVGIGRYDLEVELAGAGGIYPQAMVTYRGVEVGKVTDVELAKGGGVVARLQIDNGTELPKDSVVEVRSSSVIGEQYVNFVPAANASDGATYADGDTVPVAATVIPTTTDKLLTSVDGLLRSIPEDDLDTVVDELGLALQGAGDELGTFIDASQVFQSEAQRNLPQTIKLIEDSKPVLGTQADLDSSIRSYADSLDSFTTELAASNGDLKALLEGTGPAMETISEFAVDITGVAPGVISDLADLGEVLKVYKDGIEHVLIVTPAVLAAVTSSIPVNQRGPDRSQANLWFKLSFDPPTCTQGFENANKMRNPADLSARAPSTTSWCKVSADSVLAPRGARNHPCPNGGTGATAAACGLDFGGRRTNADAAGSTDATSGSVDLGLDSFLLSGATPSADGWQELLTGLVTP
ncbi:MULTISPECIES: MCE family protein [unclassified Nocardioides]|uniref:MCE family protein n=1 Tax=unclassified Nocardioides TaxID=2615069 RepID=UPI000703080F|nr:MULTISPECIES: MlaD family protein [unclassified Nocardioides]KRC59759.1 hypothetical protein ASE19_01700 [Nocardioides sp. Root79]KRC68414.1 hypothetical protein ASE20_16260 [Nocardioides sp. Root240]